MPVHWPCFPRQLFHLHPNNWQEPPVWSTRVRHIPIWVFATQVHPLPTSGARLDMTSLGKTSTFGFTQEFLTLSAYLSWRNLVFTYHTIAMMITGWYPRVIWQSLFTKRVMDGSDYPQLVKMLHLSDFHIAWDVRTIKICVYVTRSQIRNVHSLKE